MIYILLQHLVHKLSSFLTHPHFFFFLSARIQSQSRLRYIPGLNILSAVAAGLSIIATDTSASSTAKGIYCNYSYSAVCKTVITLAKVVNYERALRLLPLSQRIHPSLTVPAGRAILCAIIHMCTAPRVSPLYKHRDRRLPGCVVGTPLPRGRPHLSPRFIIS